MWTTFGISVWKRQSAMCQLVYKAFPAIGTRGAVVRWVPLSGDLSSSMRPKCISRIELGDVGRISHSVVVTLAGYVGSRTATAAPYHLQAMHMARLSPALTVMETSWWCAVSW